ncbi:RES family NAD+ phosphorylase [Arthrobacter monumenti]
MVVVPAPPVPFDPESEVLPAGMVLYRSYGNRRKPTEFNPGFGEPTRFAFFGNPPVPVLYAAENVEAAVCESILHHLPAKGGTLYPAKYLDRICAGLVTTRDLRLAAFHGTGLRRFGLVPDQLTSCNAALYSSTVTWAEAAWKAGFDGCVWMSSKLNSSRAYVLFGQANGSLDIDPGSTPMEFANGPDLDWLIDFCSSIKIDVEVP